MDKSKHKAAGAADATVAPVAETAPVAEEVRGDAGPALHVEGIGAAAVALGEALAVGAGGPGAGAAEVAEAVPGMAIRTTAVADEGPLRRVRVAAVARRAGRDEILPLGLTTLDPATVPGRKLATAAAQVRRDGRSYAPGETFPIDFRAHSELVPIGAIVATPWHDLPDHEG